MRLLILTTHPIQYNAPLFSYLAKHSNFSIKVFYTLGAEHNSLGKNGFGVNENWNIDLLDGYDYEFIENTSKAPSSNSFLGVKNPSLEAKVKLFEPSAILVYGWKHQSHLSIMRLFHGKIPIYFRGDSTSLDDNNTIYFLRLMRYVFLKWVYSYIDYAFSPGKASDEYFVKSGLRTKQIIRVEHSVDNNRFNNFTNEDESILQKLRNELEIGENEIVFLFAGKFIDKKNPLLLVNAFNLICQEENNCRLVLVGSGILEKQLKSQVNTFYESVKSKISFLPFQDQSQMKIVYRLADVFVLPSKSETWGLSVNEALASGIPVLVSDRCGCAADLVVDGVNGFVFKSNDLYSLHRCMKKYLINDFYRSFKLNTLDSIKTYTFKSFHLTLAKLLSRQL